jgi:hypothetical protein
MFEGSETDLVDLKPGIYLIRHEESGKSRFFVKE